MKIIIASDHAGVAYKAVLVKEMQGKGYTVNDLGTFDPNQPDDYPDYAVKVAEAILAKQGEKGIIICGSGVGVSVAANKFKGIRAGVCHDTYSAHQCVEHDDVNILCIGQRVIGIELAREVVFTFLKAVFSNEERHVKRLKKIAFIEDSNMK
jgi:ribose 5-phosphate isomerase B